MDDQIETLFDTTIDPAAISYLDQEVECYRQTRIDNGRAAACACGSPVTYVAHMQSGNVELFGRALDASHGPSRRERLRENLAFAVFGAAMSAFVSVLLTAGTSTEKTAALIGTVVMAIVALVVALTVDGQRPGSA